MQWTAEKNAGFTTGTPWIDVNPNYQTINVAAALVDKNSLFYTYQEMIRSRKEHPLVVWGNSELLETVEEVVSFYRIHGEECWLVVTNSSDKVRPFPANISVGQVMIGNMPTDVTILADYSLAPWQASVVRVSQ